MSRPNDKRYRRRTDRRSSTCQTWGPRRTGRHTWKTCNRQNKYYTCIFIHRLWAPIDRNHIPNHLHPNSRVSRVTRVYTLTWLNTSWGTCCRWIHRRARGAGHSCTAVQCACTGTRCWLWRVRSVSSCKWSRRRNSCTCCNPSRTLIRDL